MPRKFRELNHKRLQRAFEPLTLGEKQLLMLGLWVIGERDQVDFKLMGEWKLLCAQLKLAAAGDENETNPHQP
jgi:hypothetical protein